MPAIKRESQLALWEIKDSRVPVTPEVPTVPDIVDPDPHGEQGVFALPWCVRWLTRVASQEFVHLVGQRLDGGSVWLDEGRVDGRSAEGEVVGKDQRLVVNCCPSVDPDRAASNCGTLNCVGLAPCDGEGTCTYWVRWITEGVSD